MMKLLPTIFREMAHLRNREEYMNLTEIISKKEGLVKTIYGVDRAFMDDNGYLYDIDGNPLNLVSDEQLNLSRKLADEWCLVQ